jgi:hypothetical protein
MRLPPLCGCILVVFAMVGTSPARAQAPLHIGGFDNTRGGIISLATGEWVNNLRTAILNAYPGSTLSGSAALTQDYLAGLDVLIISSVASGDSPILPLTQGEQAALRQFVLAGGSAFLFTDNTDFSIANASCLEPFGLASNVDGGGGSVGVVADPAQSRVTNGPFGVVLTFPMFASGWFMGLGPDAVSLAAFADGNEPCLAVIEPHRLSATSGTVVFFSDTSMIFDMFMTPDDQALVLNAIAATRPLPCPGDFNHDGSTNSQDFFDFLACFFDARHCGDADFNHDGIANSQDFFDFLSVFFEPCQ